MRVTKIKFRGAIHEGFVDFTLSKGIMNDYLFDNLHFDIYIEDVEPIDFLYRIMYEQLYLKRTNCKYDMSSMEGKTMKMTITLSEAILFIKAALPPVFKPREKEAYQSINDIKETLLALLEEGDSQIEYMSVFKHNTGLSPFETKTNYDFKRMELMRQFNPTEPLVDVLVCSKDYDEIYDGIEGDELEDYEGSLYREPTGADLHCVFNCIRKTELDLILKIIDESHYYYLNQLCNVGILNIFKRDFSGYFVEFYIENFDSDVVKTLYEIYKRSYKQILGK